MIKFGVSLVYDFKNTSVLLNKESSINCVKIDLIQAKKKVKGHQIHRQDSKYKMPKIATEIFFVHC